MTATDDLTLVERLLTAGAAACFADLVSFPLDTTKVWLQIQGEQSGSSTPKGSKQQGLVRAVITIVRQGGFRALYNGLSPGLQRQMCFAPVRLGLYEPVKGLYQKLFDSTGLTTGSGEVSFFARLLAGLTTGAIAVVVAQPTDVVKIRFQAGTRNPGVKRYKSSLQAYRTIVRDEGVGSLWRGWIPNIARNSIVNVGEIVCYDITKEFILTRGLMEDGVPCHFASAVAAGFCATLVVSPVDVVKTRYMNASKDEYQGAMDCTLRMFRKEGFTAFYKGFTPSLCRIVSWNIMMWLTWEQLRILLRKLKKENP